MGLVSPTGDSAISLIETVSYAMGGGGHSEVTMVTSTFCFQLGLSKQDEASLQTLLKTIQVQVMASLEELTAITTYDDNLEHQYKEGKAENHIKDL